jgi:hypothetical protein
MDPIDGAELELVCLCGHENFQRVVVQRKPNPPIVTDFVACVGCRAMYFAPRPQPDPKPALAGAEMRGIGGPAPDTDDALKRDAALAARDYVKPGRSRKR